MSSAMIFEQHYLDCLSQASYFIGDETSKRAVVVDPRRDIDPYLATAQEHGMTIEMVIETHLHADFLSGHLEVAAATGATIAYGSLATTEFESRKMAHGERINLGEVELEIRHTPGHTPESISIVVYENAGDDVPYGVLTGDCLFIGDVGRPDLLSSVGVAPDDLAGSLYDSLHEQLMTLPDQTRVYPAHGAGSACGKSLSTETWSTIGQQRVENYALAPMTKAEFIEVVTAGQTAPPAYFSFEAVLNKQNHPVLDPTESPRSLALVEVLTHQAEGGVILDTREPPAFSEGHLTGSINVGLSGRFSEYSGGIISPDVPIVLVTEAGHELESKVRLARIGFDNVVGHLDDIAGAIAAEPTAISVVPRVDVDGLAEARATVADLQLVDIRQPGETANGIVEGSELIPLTQLNERLGELDPSRPTIVYCRSGFRSMIAASRMKQAGFVDVSDLIGGFNAWTEQTVTA
jgi:glyoxylase-like metal-dependent hydrolase (beta-lactamase superfamily II)/rhodanese-related sulfurtransferase